MECLGNAARCIPEFQEVVMKKTISGMWRSGVAFLLALCMVASCVPFSAFAKEVRDTNDDGVINYVSLGASNVNGYGMFGYGEEYMYEYPLLKEQANIFGYKRNTPGSYPVLVKEHLEELGHTVNLSQMAISSMRAEEVRFLLDDSYKGDAYTDWRFIDVPGYNNRNSQNWFYGAGRLEWIAQGKAGEPTPEQAVETLKEAYRKAIREADLITLDIGINNFGVYASNQIVSNMYENDLNTIDPEVAAKYAEGKAYVLDLLTDMNVDIYSIMPAEQLDHMVDSMAYALVGFCLSFDAVMEQIRALNPDAQITVVSIQNLMYGLKATLPGLDAEIPFGELFGSLINAANVYTATLSPYCEEYNYADVRKGGRVEFFSDELLGYNGDPSTLGRDMKDCFDIYDNDLYIKARIQQLFSNYLIDNGLMDISTVPAGFDIKGNLEHFALAYQYCGLNGADYLNIPLYGGTLNKFLADGAAGTLAAPFAEYYAIYDRALNTAYDVMAEIFQAGLKLDTLDASSFGERFGPVEDKLLGAFFGTLEDAVLKAVADPTFKFDLDDYYPDGIYKTLAAQAGLSEGFVNTVAAMGIRTGIGNSFFGHPNGNGQVELKNAVIKAMDEDITGKDVVSGEVQNLIKDIAKDIWNQWVNAGYVGDVEKTINKLIAHVEARYGTYEEMLLKLNTEMEELVSTKDALEAELATLKEQLAAKKAELEEVLAKQEIGSVTAPDINIEIDPDLGNNTQTTVPGNDCAVEGETVKEELEAAIADLEHAIAVLEALITDISADIADMAKVAAELAEAVKELGKTFGEIVAAGKDLMEALAAVKDVMTNESAYATAEQFKVAFEAAKASAMAALDALKVASVIADELMVDAEYMLDVIIADGEALYNKIKADLPKVIENAPMEVKIALAAALMVAEEKGWDKEWAEDQIRQELDKIKAEYQPEIDQAKKDLADLKAKIETEIEAKYEAVKAELTAEANAKLAILNAKKAALEAEIAELKAQLAAAEEAAKAAIQAQIDRLTGDLAIVDADIAHAVSHLEAALQIAYDEIVAEVNAIYAEAVAKLEKLIADLNAQLEAAIGKSLDELIALGLDGLKELKDELIALGKDALAKLVDKLVELYEQMLYKATHGEVLAGLNLKYVALGDGSNDFAAALSELLKGKAPAAFEFVNAAKPGATAADVAANLPADVADANVITLGFSQTEIIGKALSAFLNGETVDWAELMGEEAVPYVAMALEYAYGEIDAMELDEKTAAMVKAIAEAYAYGAADYAINLPILIKNIREVNPTAEIVIVGMYNPIETLAISVPNIIDVDLSAYADVFNYLVDAVYGYGVALSVIAKDVTYVDAREVEIEKNTLGLTEVDALLKGDISALYPSANGDAYIAEQINSALTVKMLGDANDDGVVDSYDATLIARYDVGLIGANDLNLAVCDVNGDGVVDSYDATLVARYDVGLLAA